MDLIEHEPAIRLLSFGLVLTAMLLWETFASRRVPTEARLRRGSRNLGLAVIDSVLVRLILPMVPVGFAALAAEWKWGLFHRVTVPPWAAIALSVVAFDLAIYLQHVLFHAVPALWRLHMVHHSDLDFDTTTGLRFHPAEIVLSLGLKLALVAAIGPPVAAVMLFEILLNGTSLFNHANVRLPPRADRYLRWLVVTPDMHRVHHSVDRAETNSNFGFNLSWWDRLLGTYREEPAAGHEDMTIGLEHLRDARGLTLGKLLALPFRGRTGTYSMSGTSRGGPSATDDRRPRDGATETARLDRERGASDGMRGACGAMNHPAGERRSRQR